VRRDRRRCQTRGASFVQRCVRRVSLTLSLVVLLALTASPAARGSDNSAVDQYTENVPGAGGDHPSGGGGSGGGGSGGGGSGGQSTLSPAAKRDLQAQGPIGSKTARLAEATAPRGVGAGGKGNGAGKAAGGQGQGSAHGTGGSGLGNTVDHAVGGGDPGGLGVAFPIILGSSLLAALAFLVLRWRRRTAAH
jgi:hypothetical protein